MKKTLIALMALAGVACGADELWKSDISLNTTTTYAWDEVGFITKTGNDTSPGVGTLILTFNLTAIPEVGATYNLLSVKSSNIGSAQGQSTQLNTYGFFIEGTTLTFGRGGTDNTNYSLTDNKVSITDSLAADTTYTLTLVSNATGSPSGRGSDNFTIVLMNEAETISSKQAAGFGLNGERCTGFAVGATELSGTASLGAYVIPEPATATLSLLALAGLAARRRRR